MAIISRRGSEDCGPDLGFGVVGHSGYGPPVTLSQECCPPIDRREARSEAVGEAADSNESELGGQA